MCEHNKEKNIKIMQDIINALDGINMQQAVNDTTTLVPGNLEDEKLFMQKMINTLNTEIDKPTYVRIKERIEAAGANYYSNSNISAFIEDGEKEELINEATEAFTKVLDTLVIDHKNDPNAMGTPKRLAKMYINELFAGRYLGMPAITAFPNKHTGKDTGFGGMLVVRSEFISECSHHWQEVRGTVFIGIIPEEEVIGLSKYTRLVQWLARRGTLQEELTEDVASAIMEVSGAKSVGVYIEGRHNCCEVRGILATNSKTQTTVLKGDFMNDPTVRKEFLDNIAMQQMNSK